MTKFSWPNRSKMLALQHLVGFRGAVVVALLISFFVVSCSAGILQARDDVEVGQKALSTKKYPWYDAETDEVKRVDLGERPSARSSNRNNIPLKPVRKPRTNSSNWNWNLGGSFLGGLSPVAWGLIALVIVVLALALIWAFLRMEPNVQAEDDQAPRRTMAESIKQLPFELDVGTGDFRQLAENSYRSGDYQRAMIFLFSHVLVQLDQKGHIRQRKGKTNRQYLSELRAQRPLANYYQRVMVPFEATFFGDHDLGKQEFENCWNQLGEFQAGLDQTSQVAHV
jgi:hypothetical protein